MDGIDFRENDNVALVVLPDDDVKNLDGSWNVNSDLGLMNVTADKMLEPFYKALQKNNDKTPRLGMMIVIPNFNTKGKKSKKV